MKCSIITVSFNAIETIENTILSVAAQDYPDIEHVVIDGGSTDGTQEILKRHRDRFATLVCEPDKGIYDAMNKGLARATGDVIGFLHADDVYSHERVISRIMGIMESEGLDALYGDAEFFRAATPGRVFRRYNSSRFSPERLSRGWMPAHPALFLRRGVYDQFGHFRPNYRIAGDFEYVARIFSKGSLSYRYLPEVLVRMQIGGISTCGIRSTWLLNQEVLRACRENDIDTNAFKILTKYPSKLLDFIIK